MPNSARQKVLEVGYGGSPACEEGEIFHDGTVQYAGLELPADFRGSFQHFFGEIPAVPAVTASAHAMPFPDGTFDYLVMRSVFGQVEDYPETSIPLRLGIYECFRVLKAGGLIVVAEENTPPPAHHISLELKLAGFAVMNTDLMPCRWEDIDRSSEWYVRRNAFYSGKPVGIPPTVGDYERPYIITGTKQQGVELEEFLGAPINADFFRQSPGIKDRPVQQLTYKRPKSV